MPIQGEGEHETLPVGLQRGVQHSLHVSPIFETVKASSQAFFQHLGVVL
jgi:hypothetical protein